MSAPTYDAYRDSGIDWLGKVPGHWKIDRLKASVASSKGGIWGEEADGGEEDIVCIRVADFRRRDFSISMDDPTVRKIAAKDRNGRIVSRGNLLLEKSGGGEKQPVGAVSLYDHDVPAVCSNFVTRLELEAGMHPSFWRYVHAAAYDRGLTFRSLNQTSGIQNLDQARYLDERAAYPPPAEQAAIAAFLDRETGKIDALVEAQTRLIELLKEKRQAVISHAVTKGLDPAAPMKDSGVEWLGQVPAHWEVVPIRSLFRFVRRQDGDELDVLSVYRDYGVISKASRDDNNNVTPEDLSKYQTVRPGDLVVNKMKAWQGSLGISNLTGITSPDYAVFEPIHSGSADYLHLLLRSPLLPDVFRLISNGIRLAQWRLEPEKFKELRVPWPPVAEQQTIGVKLAKDAARMELLASEASRGIALLHEHRAALISAAVTGKIDVRGLAPEQAEA